MALLWSHESEGNLYEVRSAGASLRLYRNGVNHSQWNPDRPLSGSIWDLITLPALHRPAGEIEDALMLGFGAGAVAKQLIEVAGVEHVVGVELDPMHLSIAQGFFDCDDRCELVAGDAVDWLWSEGDMPRYDLIIDDLYAEEDGVPVRCAPLDLEWFSAMTKLLRPGGILVLNMVEPKRVGRLPILNKNSLKKRLPHAVMYQISGYENRVLAFSDQPFVGKDLKRALRSVSQRYPRCSGVAKRYKAESL